MSWSTQVSEQWRLKYFVHWAITIWGRSFQNAKLYSSFLTSRVTPVPTLQPLYMAYNERLLIRCMPHTGLGFFPFARRYSGNNICSLFLLLLRCFTSQGSLSASQSLQYSNCKSCLIRKPPDQRLLRTSPKNIATMPRPSSPLRVKASTIRPYVHWEHKKPSS